MARRSAVLVLVLGLAGCSGVAGDLKGTSDEARVARQALDAVAKGNGDAVLSLWDPTRIDSQLTSALGQVIAAFPREPPKHVRLIRVVRTRGTGGGDTPAKTCTIMFQSDYAEKVILSQVVLRTDGSEPQVVGLHANPVVPGDETGISADEVPFLIMFVGFMLAAALVTLGAIRIWVRYRKSLRHPVLWLVAILVGICRANLMLGVGKLGLQPLYAQLLSVGFWRNDLTGSWTLSLSLPLGAIVFVFKALQGRLPLRVVPPAPGSEPSLPPPVDPPAPPA